MKDIQSAFLDKKKYPNCFKGEQYARDVINGDILSCVYIRGACERYFRDRENPELELKLQVAEDFMMYFQRFEHVIGEWKTPNLVLEPWQCFFYLNVEGFYWKEKKKRKYKSAHLEVSRGNGKAGCLETLIPTPKGMTRLGDLHVGDTVYDRNGKECQIIAETPVHYPEQYEVEFNQGFKIKASGEHLWFTQNKTERTRETRHKKRPPKYSSANKVYESIINTKEMSKKVKAGGTFGGKEECNYTIKTAMPIKGRSKNLLLDPWYLGYWLGNGDKGGSKIYFDYRDYNNIKSILTKRKLIFSQVKKCNVSENGASIYIKEVIGLIRKELVLNNKHIPKKYLFANYQDRLDLLRGLLDSDGTISIEKAGGKVSRRISFATVRKDLADQVLILVNGLGFKGTVIERKIVSNFNTDNEIYYDVCFTPVCDLSLFLVKRKAIRQKREVCGHTYTKNHYIKSITKIKRKNMVPMKCIEVNSPDKSFVWTEYFIPTHNSAMLSVMGLLYLNLVPTVKGNHVYSTATKKEQARIVFDSARQMAMANKSYVKGTKTTVFAHSIIHAQSGSKFVPLSADSKGLDGLQPVLGIVDELHCHKDRRVFDVMDTAMSKRSDSLLCAITTAGFSLDGIGYSQSCYAKKVSLGEVDDESFFSLVYTLDEDDDWKDENVWIKANPNMGISVDPDSFKSKALKAQNNPQDETNFKVKHLNLWQNAATQYFDLKKWETLAQPKLSIKDFIGEHCYVGIDLASKIDLTSIAYIFKKEEKYYVFSKNYVPKDTVTNSRNVLYPKWVEDGSLIATEGQAINYPKLQEDFLESSKGLKIIGSHYDPWNATEFAQRMIHEYVEMVEFRMTTANMSEPMKKLDSLIREGNIIHNGNELVTWCLRNVVAKVDANDNVFPRKEHESLKIDPIIAIIMALAGWVQEENQGSVYDGRGMIFIA